MVKYYDWDPYKLPSDLHQAIGLACACFAQSEGILQEAIAGCLGLDYELSLAVTTHMPMPLRFSVLRAAAEITIDDVDTLDQLDDILDEFEEAITKRNNVVHNRWNIDPENGATAYAKYSARRTVLADLTPMTAKQVLADAEFIYNVGMKLFQFTGIYGIRPALVERPSRAHKSQAARKQRRKQRL